MRILPILLALLVCLTGCAAPHAQLLSSPPPDLMAAPAATPIPADTAPSLPASAPEATAQVPDYTSLGCVYAVTAPLYAEPDEQSACLRTLPQGQTLHLSAQQGDFYPAKCGNAVGYVRAADAADLGQQASMAEGMVNVRLRDDSILCYMLFAQQENFCGHPLYDADVCMLEAETYAKLYAAQQRFLQDGYCIKLNDAYRPQRVQYMLFEEIPDRTYIANPATGSRHNRGLAVDMTLVDLKTGLEIEMPSPMHTFGGAGRRDYKDHSAAAKANMDYMTGIMEECGFTGIRSEWWHFMDISNESSYPLLDIPQSSFLTAD